METALHIYSRIDSLKILEYLLERPWFGNSIKKETYHDLPKFSEQLFFM